MSSDSVEIDFIAGIKVKVPKVIGCMIGSFWINCEEEKYRVWEKTQLERLHHVLQQLSEGKPFDFVDAGCNMGSYTLLSIFFPKSHFWAFEPQPRLVRIARDILALNKIPSSQAQVTECALGSTEGKASLQASSSPYKGFDHTGVATMARKPLRFDGFYSIPVTIQTLDSFEQRFTNLLYIKIDTEGYEWPVLQGARQLINRFRPIIQAEMNSVNSEQCEQPTNWSELFCRQFKYVLVEVNEEEGMFCPQEKESQFRCLWLKSKDAFP